MSFTTTDIAGYKKTAHIIVRSDNCFHGIVKFTSGNILLETKTFKGIGNNITRDRYTILLYGLFRLFYYSLSFHFRFLSLDYLTNTLRLATQVEL